MKLTCIGSSSSGNCYILHNNDEALVIECGCRMIYTKKALDYNISKIKGCLCSHIHQDHSKYIKNYMNIGISVYSSDEVQQSIQEVHGELIKTIPPNKAIQIGNFIVQTFPLIHDVPCVGFLIKHSDIGKMLFITDTEMVKQKFTTAKINHILIESNYSKDILDNGKANRNHVLTGHMDIETTCQFLRTNDTPQLKNVVLLHLSDKNSNEEQFIKQAINSVHGGVNVYAADTGMEIDVSLVPFI